ncbi:MAG: DUF3817 domain-containing protein [Gammaproteobacteria bacterium]
MLKAFRIISVLEGLSFLTLLSLVVFEFREHIFVVGMGHGVLFMAYFVGALLVSHKMGWSILFWLLVLLCAVIPFAFIPLEWKLNRMGNEASAGPDADSGAGDVLAEGALQEATFEEATIHAEEVPDVDSISWEPDKAAGIDRALALTGGGGLGVAGLIVAMRYFELI